MEEFVSYPNQKRITLHKEKTDNQSEDNYYAKINLIALKHAMHNLTPKAFELWMYLSKNKADATIWLSKENFMEWSGVKRTSYYEALKELEKDGYLIADDEVNNKYHFYEVPKTDDEILEIKMHKEIGF